MTAAIDRIAGAVFPGGASDLTGGAKSLNAPVEQNTDSDAQVIKLRSLLEEARADRQQRMLGEGMNIEQWWQLQGRRWMGDHHEEGAPAGVWLMTLNRDEIAITQNVADQTSEPFRVRFKAMNTSARTKLYVRADYAEDVVDLFKDDRMAPLLRQAGITRVMAMGGDRLTQNQAIFLRSLSEPIFNPETGQEERPAVLDGDPVLRLDAAFRAKAIQRVMTKKWAQGHGDEFLSASELLSNIYGHNNVWFEFDSNWDLRLQLPHIRNVYATPNKMFPWTFDFVAVTEVMRADEAKLRWPHMAGDIEAVGSAGSLNNTMLGGNVGAADNIQYRTEVIEVVTGWMRGEKVKMFEDEAVATGKVEMTAEEGQRVFRLQATGEVVDEDSPNWPSKDGILMIKYIAGTKKAIVKARCPYIEIPMAWNMNLPIPWSPYGKGESFRLRSLQDGINQLGTAIMTHLEYWKYPAEYWPRSLLEDMKQAGQDPHIHAGVQLGIEDADFVEWFRSGRLQGFAVQPPPIPTSVVEMWRELRVEHQMMSGHTGVRQGVAPGADTSGKAIGALLEQAAGPVIYKARFTARAVEYIWKTCAQFLVDFMPAKLWQNFFPEVSDTAFEELWSELPSLEYAVECHILAGRGSVKRLERQENLENLQIGAIDMERFQENSDIADAEGIRRRIQKSAEASIAQNPQTGPGFQATRTAGNARNGLTPSAPGVGGGR
jgi:hypothetical protein